MLSGAVTPAQLGSNVGALALDLDGVSLTHFAVLAEDPSAYWATRSGLAWS